MNRRQNTGVGISDDLYLSLDNRLQASRRIVIEDESHERTAQTLANASQSDNESIQDFCCCEICTEPYLEEVNSRRPFVLTCGHTFCKGCVEMMNKCANCKQINHFDFANQSGMKGSFNFQLEGIIRDTHEQRTLSWSENQQFKSVHFCLDCMCPFNPSELMFMSETHKGHKTISLHKKDPSLVHSLLWIGSKTRSRTNDFSSCYNLLQIMLALAHELQIRYETVQEHFKTNSEEVHQALKHDCMKLIKEGSNSANFRKPRLIESLISLRNMQVEFGHLIFKAARCVGPDPLPSIITEEIYKQSEKDYKSTENIGIDQSLMQLQGRLASREVFFTARRDPIDEVIAVSGRSAPVTVSRGDQSRSSDLVGQQLPPAHELPSLRQLHLPLASEEVAQPVIAEPTTSLSARPINRPIHSAEKENSLGKRSLY